MNIYLSIQESQALMKKLDIDSDGTISEQELARALEGAEIP